MYPAVWTAAAGYNVHTQGATNAAVAALQRSAQAELAQPARHPAARELSRFLPAPVNQTTRPQRFEVPLAFCYR